MRVALCDDHALFLEALVAALPSYGIDIVGIAPTPRHTTTIAASGAPDIFLLDVGFPDDDGLSAIGRIRLMSPSTSVVMYSACSDNSVIATALSAGARGFLSKTLDLAVTVAALERIANGEVVVLASHPSARLIPAQRRRDTGESMLLQYLTDRERDVLRRLMRGDSTDEIAAALTMARSTTRTHIQNVLAKLGTHSRRAAVAFAARQGMQPLPVAGDAATSLIGAGVSRAPSE
jgi:DNA-binding NarL/FixJ family response regulator